MRGFRLYLTLTWVVFLMLNAPSIMRAQSLSDARSSFSKGQYKTAVSYYNAIIEEYKDNGQSTYNLEQERSKAITCRDLLSEVERLKKRQRYSDAIAKLRQIVNLNPADPTIKAKIRECESLRERYLAQKAIDDDWKKCRILSDYYSFRKNHPDSKYDSQAISKIRELEEIADEERWKLALSRNTVESYQSYINSKTTYSKHISEANKKLFPLLISKASSLFDGHDYAAAKATYERAKQLFSLPEISLRNYKKCCEEVDFEKLSKASYRFKTNLRDFISQYPSSEHVSLVRGWLVENEMSSGNFDVARSIVENYTVSFSESFTPDVKWWRKNIKAREKQYKKDHSGKSTAKATKNKHSSSIYSSNPLIVRLPITLGIMGISNRYAQFGAGLTFGDYDNKFNLDLMVTSLSDGGYDEHVFFSIAPTYNILRCSEQGYHLNIQPVIGYNTKYALMGGVRAGIGWDYFDFSIGASYANEFGFLTDFKLRININIVGRK